MMKLQGLLLRSGILLSALAPSSLFAANFFWDNGDPGAAGGGDEAGNSAWTQIRVAPGGNPDDVSNWRTANIAAPGVPVNGPVLPAGPQTLPGTGDRAYIAGGADTGSSHNDTVTGGASALPSNGMGTGDLVRPFASGFVPTATGREVTIGAGDMIDVSSIEVGVTPGLGYGGHGAVNMSDGQVIVRDQGGTGAHLLIGANNEQTGTWTQSGGLTVVDDTANNRDIYVGNNFNTEGFLNLSGTATMGSSRHVLVGQQGTIQGGRAAHPFVGSNPAGNDNSDPSSGMVVLSGTSRLQTGEDVYVGRNGRGVMDIDGGTLIVGNGAGDDDLFIGSGFDGLGGYGELNLNSGTISLSPTTGGVDPTNINGDGQNGLVNSGGDDIFIGNNGYGVLNQNGGDILFNTGTGRTIEIGRNQNWRDNIDTGNFHDPRTGGSDAASTGVYNFNDGNLGTNADHPDQIQVGQFGNGYLNHNKDGGTLQSDNQVWVGYRSSGYGEVNINATGTGANGNTATLHVDADMWVGYGGEGVVNQDGAGSSVDIQNNDLVIGSDSNGNGTGTTNHQINRPGIRNNNDSDGGYREQISTITAGDGTYNFNGTGAALFVGGGLDDDLILADGDDTLVWDVRSQVFFREQVHGRINGDADTNDGLWFTDNDRDGLADNPGASTPPGGADPDGVIPNFDAVAAGTLGYTERVSRGTFNHNNDTDLHIGAGGASNITGGGDTTSYNGGGNGNSGVGARIEIAGGDNSIGTFNQTGTGDVVLHNDIWLAHDLGGTVAPANTNHNGNQTATWDGTDSEHLGNATWNINNADARLDANGFNITGDSMDVGDSGATAANAVINLTNGSLENTREVRADINQSGGTFEMSEDPVHGMPVVTNLTTNVNVASTFANTANSLGSAGFTEHDFVQTGGEIILSLYDHAGANIYGAPPTTTAALLTPLAVADNDLGTGGGNQLATIDTATFIDGTGTISSASDLLVADFISLDGTLTIDLDPSFSPTWSVGQQWDLFDWTHTDDFVLGSNFAFNLPSLTGVTQTLQGYDYFLQWDTSLFATNGVIFITIPEPSRVLLLGLGLGLLFLRRQR